MRTCVVLRPRGALVAAALLLAACAQMPVGPMVAAMPGPNKPFEVFMQDDALCRNWASRSIGQPGYDPAAQQMLGSTAAGAVLGAVIGGLLGGGDSGAAGAGAAMGTMFGASAGANQSAYTAANAQRAYDITYMQCMQSRGNLVSGGGYPPYGWRPPAGMPPPPAPVLR